MKWFQKEALIKDIMDLFRLHSGMFNSVDPVTQRNFKAMLKERLEKHLGPV